MGFRDLSDVLETPDRKVLPINGEDVEFPRTVSAKVGAMLLTLYSSLEASEGLDPGTYLESLGWSEDDAAEIELGVLGKDGAATLDRLGVLGPGRMRVMSTLVFWHLLGTEAAELVWEGKAPAPANRETRRAAGRSPKTAGGGGPRTGTAAGGSSARPRTTRAGAGRTGPGSASTGA